nr:glycan-binding surface protein [uncultured Carboxylicivirga sp.]
MKNKRKYINRWMSLAFMGVMTLMLLFTSCEDDSTYSGPITISKVYLQDATSSVPDREVEFARLGQLIRIEGSGFTDLKRVYINGASMYFNPVMVSDNSMLVAVSRETPIIDADPEVRNTIRLANDGSEAKIDFEIRAAAPTITNISHTLPLPGEMITVYGTGLLEVDRVVFPGDVEVTTGITSDEEGEFFTVAMPEGVSAEGGSIFIDCANGGAYSPAYFNFKPGVILDFDGNGSQGFWSWSEDGSMINDEDLESSTIGTDNISQGIYVPHRPARLASFAAASTRCSEVWTAGNDVDDWRGQLTPYIPVSTPLSEVAVQFDVYVPVAWESTGYLKVCLVNGFNGGEWAGYCYNYVPWIEGGEVVPFQTTGWTTVTIPFTDFYGFNNDRLSEADRKDWTFQDVLDIRANANYRNFGFYFENTDFNYGQITGENSDEEIEFTSSATSVDVYTDNWRIVPLDTPSYSDFPDEE